jgi:choline-sulfatase
VPHGKCEDDFIGDRALAAIDGFSDEFPWHCFVSFVGPHNPFDPAPEYAERWRDADMPDPIPAEPEGRPARYRYAKDYDLDTHRQARRQYTAYLEQIDFQIGRLLDRLEERGELDTTHIVFSADHGEMLGDHGRYTKSCHYEASVRIPLIVTGPGIEAGTSDALVELNDVGATCCDLAGIGPVPTAQAKSLAPLLRGDRDEHRP